MEGKVKELISKLTLEEKASLCSGKNFWHLKGIERFNLPSIMVTDGPHGMRKQTGEGDHVGINDSIPATCFPTASATASSWNRDLMKDIGSALGEECKQENVSVLLGPGANIKRSPLCGRNFEYISEDPYLTGKMAASFINGVQSKGIGTSLKHFAVNNQEERRMVIDAVVDERTLREIYLTGFEIAVKESQPWTVMCAYNKLNSIYCSDHENLLSKILKEEWGHTGLVVTDWGACNDRVQGIKSGLELEMPASAGVNDQLIVNAVNCGTLTTEDLDRVVERLINLILLSKDQLTEGYKFDHKAHHDLARRAAVESTVLLKNEDNILPLDDKANLLILGEFAKTPRYQGSGSSHINPIHLESALDELGKINIEYSFLPGYRIDKDIIDEKMISEAVNAAKSSETVVIYAGLTPIYESEGFDREHINLPKNHDELIQRVTEVNSNVIVVLQNGSPVAMPWIDRVKAVVESYLGGEAGGPASIDILLGKENPSGKLAETFPKKLEDTASAKWFPMGPKTVEYRESLYVGYRYNDSLNVKPLFPFGFGLSYTTFEYSDLKLSETKIKSEDVVEVSVKIKNSGKVDGAETVQIYVKDIASTIFRPEKELKEFSKVYLKSGEVKTVTFKLNKRAFAFYDVNSKDWVVESGVFEIMAAASSDDIRLVTELTVESSTNGSYSTKETTPEYYDLKTESFDVSDSSFRELIGRDLPERNFGKKEKFTITSTLGEVKSSFVGRILYKQVLKMSSSMAGGDNPDEATTRMVENMIFEMPIRSLVLMSNGRISYNMAEGLLKMMNGQFFKGLKQIRQK